MLVLASNSAGRRAILSSAGIPHEAVAAGVDEESAKRALRADGLDARGLADALAELKALKVSGKRPADLVLGCDQTLSLDDGTMLDKADDPAMLGEQLKQLSGRTHFLHSAIVIAEGGRAVWRHVERIRMTMRALSADFIADYIKAEGDVLLGCVGGYRIEGPGAQLFSRIEGSHFGIVGLPLLPLLDYLRTRGILAS